jgi:hypothetical protein
VAEHGVKLFQAAVERDLEGVVAKQRNNFACTVVSAEPQK